MHIDLRPYMQRAPFLVHANASLSRAYRLFRTMGLHTLYVGQAKPLVMGVITRKVGGSFCAQLPGRTWASHDRCEMKWQDLLL